MIDPKTAETIFTAARIQVRRIHPDATDADVSHGAAVLLANTVEALLRLANGRWMQVNQVRHEFFATMQSSLFSNPVDPDNRHHLTEAHEDCSKCLLALGLPPLNL